MAITPGVNIDQAVQRVAVNPVTAGNAQDANLASDGQFIETKFSLELDSVAIILPDMNANQLLNNPIENAVVPNLFPTQQMSEPALESTIAVPSDLTNYSDIDLFDDISVDSVAKINPSKIDEVKSDDSDLSQLTPKQPALQKSSSKKVMSTEVVTALPVDTKSTQTPAVLESSDILEKNMGDTIQIEVESIVNDKTQSESTVINVPALQPEYKSDESTVVLNDNKQGEKIKGSSSTISQSAEQISNDNIANETESVVSAGSSSEDFSSESDKKFSDTLSLNDKKGDANVATHKDNTTLPVSKSLHNIQEAFKSNHLSAPSATVVNSTVGQQLNVAIKDSSLKDTKEMTVQLKPAGLGKVSIKLEFAQDGRSTVVVATERSDTLELLKQDKTILMNSLNDQDPSLNLNEDSFTFHQQQSQQNNSEQDDQKSNDPQSSGTVDPGLQSTTQNYRSSHAGMYDEVG